MTRKTAQLISDIWDDFYLEQIVGVLVIFLFFSGLVYAIRTIAGLIRTITSCTC